MYYFTSQWNLILKMPSLPLTYSTYQEPQHYSANQTYVWQLQSETQLHSSCRVNLFITNTQIQVLVMMKERRPQVFSSSTQHYWETGSGRMPYWLVSDFHLLGHLLQTLLMRKPLECTTLWRVPMVPVPRRQTALKKKIKKEGGGVPFTVHEIFNDDLCFKLVFL